MVGYISGTACLKHGLEHIIETSNFRQGQWPNTGLPKSNILLDKASIVPFFSGRNGRAMEEITAAWDEL
jgi:hypothetical protein